VKLPTIAAALLGLLMPALSAGTSAASIASHAPYAIALENGIDVWVAPGAAGHLGCVRLEADVGLRDEGPGNYGMAAALGASLLRGATAKLPPGGAEKLGLDVGLRPAIELDTTTTALTLCGPAAAIQRALWLTGERLSGIKVDKNAFKVVQRAIWHGARGSRYEAVSRRGDALDTAMAQALGPRDGNNAFISRINASRYQAIGFERRVNRALNAARFRVVIAAPSSAMPARRVEAWVKNNLGPLPKRVPTARPEVPQPSGAVQRISRMRHGRDAAYLYAAAWDLRGVNALTGFSRVKNDAAMFTLHQLLDQNSGLLEETLVNSHQVARRVDTRLATDDNASLAIEVEARSRDTRDAARLLLEEIGRLASTELPAEMVTAAARAVIVGTRIRWQHAAGRAALLAQLVGSGRLKAPESASDWLERFERALATLTPADIKTYAAFSFTADRRVVITMLPERPARPEVELTKAVIGTYRRMVVDVRCATWGEQPPLRLLLERKYKWSPRRYVEVTRALTRQRPGLMREMIREADLVCGEWQRLAGLVGTRKKALALHKAVACGPARMKADRKRDRAMARIFGKKDLDSSVYRPLINMLRADVRAMEEVAAIDKVCKPRFGPAVP